MVRNEASQVSGIAISLPQCWRPAVIEVITDAFETTYKLSVRIDSATGKSMSGRGCLPISGEGDNPSLASGALFRVLIVVNIKDFRLKRYVEADKIARVNEDMVALFGPFNR
ncbi:hypothetical protein NPIL_347451 [Nephila pilipes]|uniref:Uncharacterized protein n=1 Tax=Nephila pilipes TaxID=299642 RepID=A0A8X6P929_NEPPI|nr:hypothetical protein NPIL_347451 [Nephila pilipes]